MSRSPQSVQAELLALSPPGYTRSADSVWATQLLPAATEGALFEATAEEMLREIDPRTAAYLLPDWTILFGPDPYGIDTNGLSPAQRQVYDYQRLVQRGGQSVAFFVGLAAAQGVAITITQARQTVYGTAQYGANVYCESPAQFVWRVDVALPPPPVIEAVYGTAHYGDCYGGTRPLSGVERTIKALAPAHTLPVFYYTGSE